MNIWARVVSIAWLAACGPRAESHVARLAATTPDAATLVSLGRAAFFDGTLSASGRQSCASCHNRDFGWAAPNALAVQTGGAAGTSVGTRAVPTLGYAQDTPPFTEHYHENDGNDSEDLGPTGGLMWDGRAGSLKEQAALPLLSPVEMGNANRAAVLMRLRASSNAASFRAAFGERVMDDTSTAWNALLTALDAFQQSPEDFSPYSSKYDAVLRGDAKLSEQEQRGLALFNDPAKGNCAQCHPSARVRGAFPQFTDRGFIALGVPRNPRIAANADTNAFDLGLCGPTRRDLASRAEYCGLFKTPTLRNVAQRRVFFHNGVFTSLEQVLRFYARRDVEPQAFYPVDSRGQVTRFNDLPRRYWGNVNNDAPFGAKPGQRPAFSDDEAADIIAFLQTLTDGYTVTRAR